MVPHPFLLAVASDSVLLDQMERRQKPPCLMVQMSEHPNQMLALLPEQIPA